ncbi:hypothetical protein CRG98_010907 [Punica granatum]|uniref:Uncharacterized protein n=1 Tax=Punica granatum TaxID=22663 RepID=A0A2I0KKL8_PUNGR|nr:hypothetical protein CRG98_010907 [Punica granatum]
MDIPCNLVPHSDRRTRGPLRPAVVRPKESAPLSGLLSAPPMEVFYMNGWKGGNGGKRNSGKNNGGKGKNFGGKGRGGSKTWGILPIEAKE